MHGLEIPLALPDLWQQQAVRLLRAGQDVVVHAPTGAGKTFIFEMLYPTLRGQAIFTVPTRALANDKLAEWRQRGWDVGISTGDLAENLNARVVVATLETQKAGFLRRTGPRLLVIDEYQLIGDERRGVNYELCLALAPPETQLLLLSGSVENPPAIVDWLNRLGRSAVLIRHDERPVPLEEIMAQDLRQAIPNQLSGFWPKLVARALAAGLGPLLIFAPRRKAAEELALALSAALASPETLTLSLEQTHLAGEKLARCLSHRIAWHHSGLSYALRAGLIEPLAKRGHLRVVVATMGLAAGINFSMRTVLITGTSYNSGYLKQELRPDELLQMFGRAGRRGLDEIGYALTSTDLPRLYDARPRRLKRALQIDWPSLLAVMQAAVQRGDEPCHAALELSQRLFSIQSIPVGFEDSLTRPPLPCGLMIDAARARLVRRFEVEMLNSREEWELQPRQETVLLGEALLRVGDRWHPALGLPGTLQNRGAGNLCKLSADLSGPTLYGREWIAATVREDLVYPTKPTRHLLREAGWSNGKVFSKAEFREKVWPLLEARTAKGQLLDPLLRQNFVVAQITFAAEPILAWRDQHGAALLDPPVRRELPAVCQPCPHRTICEGLAPAISPALAWRLLGLVTENGNPTRRGILFSYFNHGEGLAIAAALEHPAYAIEDLVFDLANLRAGHRFAGDDSPYGGRIGFLCQQTYGRAEYPGYLEMGVPPGYGNGAGEVMRELTAGGLNRQRLLNEELRLGDIERAQLEWRSLLRQIAGAPELDWPRWQDLQLAARTILESGTRRMALPPLLGEQLLRHSSSASPSRTFGKTAPGQLSR